MKSLAVRLRLILFTLAATLLSSASMRAANTNIWTNAVSGLWRDGTNWSSNQPPNSTFNFILITNAGTKTITIDSSTPSTNLTIPRLNLSAPSGSTNTLSLIDVTTNLPLQLVSSLVVDRGGILTLTNSGLSSVGVTIDHGGIVNSTNSLITQSGVLTLFDVVNGSAWFEGGLIDCSGIEFIRVGRTNSAFGAGTLTVNGANVRAPQIEIATSTSSTGNVTVIAGTLNASGAITVGFGVNSTGSVSVAGGQLIATNDVTYLGKSGPGQMTVSAGNATFAFLSVGNNANGQLAISGGQLTMKPRDTNDWLQIGNIGAGQLNLSGGTILSAAEFHIGDDSSGLHTGSGVATITGGQIIATNDLTAIGRYGPGQMTISNATAWLTNVSVGRHDGSVGTLTVLSNAQMFLQDALSIGRFSNSVGHVIVNGGLISLTNDLLWVGREGSGDMTLSNGIVRAAGSFVAISTVVTDSVTLLPVTNIPTGTLTIAGGNLILSSNLLIGSSLLSTGQVFVAGGSLTVTGTPGPVYLSVASGSFTLSKGTVTIDNLFVTNATGQFTFNGGLLQAKNISVSNGAPFVIGDGVDPATLQLQGGIYSFANGLVVSPNATVTGCGTIIGSITNNGTIATNCGPAGVTITSIRKSGSNVVLTFTTLAGSNHVTEFKSSLTGAVWTPILPGTIGNGNVMTNFDTNAVSPARFYRIHLQ